MVRRISFGLKLTLALALAASIAVGTVAVLSNRSAARHFEDYVSYEMRPRILALVPLLAEHYATTGTWKGAERILETARPGHGMMGRGAGGMGMQTILTDARGQVIHDTTGRYQGRRLNATALERGQPIRVGEAVVGYLLAADGPREQAFGEQINASILWAGMAGGLAAILLGIALTRAMVRPLRDLRDAARRIGAGDLSYRLSISSRDEIGEVARQFNEMAAALEESEQWRRRMMADIAHELRTPLAVMRGQVEALMDGVFELTSENLSPIYDQTLLLSRLLDDLRDLALADAGQLHLERTEVHLERLIARVVEAFRSIAQEKGLEISVEISPDLPTIIADAQRLEQVLGNLLSNALRYTPSPNDGGKPGRILVRAWAEPQQVAFAVIDNGPGIPQEELSRVFERFYRTDKARSRALGGSGLGLAIVKQLVEAHGGSVEVESALGKGSTFTVRLPCALTESN